MAEHVALIEKTLKWILKKRNMRTWIGFMWLSDAFCEHCNEPSCFIKSEKFIVQLNNYQLLKNDFAPWSLLVNSWGTSKCGPRLDFQTGF
jgi:hypothetical protein